MARSKNITHYCTYCNKDTKMGRVGPMEQTENGDEDKSSTRTWYRCARCHHNALIDEEKLTALKESAESKVLTKDQCIDYSPEKSFSVGEAIYHSGWDDMGWVKEKELMSDGRSAIIVTFQKLGERKLVDCFCPDDITDTQGGEV